MQLPSRLVAPLSPSDILFTQDSIAPFTTNKNGETRSLQCIIEDLKDGILIPGDFPTIRVVRVKDDEDAPGKYWTLDNRRLYMFQEASIQSVDVEIVPREQHEAEFSSKNTTVCNGVSIDMRGPSHYNGEKLLKTVLGLTGKDLRQSCDERRPPRQLRWNTLEERILMWMLFVNQELRSELASKYRLLSNTPSSTSAAAWTECNGSLDVALLSDELRKKKLRPGDICVVKTADNVDHLVIVEGRTRDVEWMIDEGEQEYEREQPVNVERLTYRTGPSLAEGTMIQFIGEIGSVTTSRRQLDALELLSKNTTLHNLLMYRDEDDKQQLQQALLARNNQKSLWDPSCTWNWSSPNARRLNVKQRDAVEMAMTNRVSLIQGPPGTGKTHTIAVLLHTYVNYFNAHDEKVLAAAPSNLATQLLAKKFVEIGEFGVKVSPICVLQCDESHLTKDDVTSQREVFARFSTDVVWKSTNLASIHSTIKSKRAFLVGPEDEATLKKNCPPDHFPQLRSNKRQDSWVDFVNSCFRMLEKAARVFFTTCSGAANLQSKGLSFSLVVVDEAGKATQPDSFVATSLLTGVNDATRVVLVGDHKQLRPQLATKEYENTSFGESLMERLDDFRFPLTMLEVQFRMHPNIRHVVSSLTYGGKLTDDRERVTSRPVPFCCTSLIAHENLRGHVAFIDCSNGREEKERHGTSFINHAESEVVFRLLEQLVHAESTTIAVLSPYNGQVRRMREQFEQRAPRSNAKVTFCSVDASQGKEYDIVVLSLVRSSASLGFLKDERRFNVAISRAQHLLIVVGNKQSVIKAPMIEDFIALLSDEPQKVKRGPVKRPRSA